MADVLVIGLGNPLRGDDGVGARVIEHLEKLDLPAGVDILDGGTVALDWFDLIANRRLVIIVDAVQGGGPSGTIFRFAPKDVAAGSHLKTSSHGMGLLEILALAEALGRNPAGVVIFGIEPKSIGWGAGLSPEVEAAVLRVAEMVAEEARSAAVFGRIAGAP